jgi:hypothetical protein
MANEIHNYPLEIYTIGNNDFLDVDYFNGVGYDSAKILGSNLKASVKSGIYTMISPSTYVTGTAEQSIIDGSSLGSLSVPANGFQVGDTFRLTMRGYIGAHNNDTLTINLYTNGTTLLTSTGPITMPTIGYKAFELIVDFVINAVGGPMVAGVTVAGGFSYNKDSANIYEGQDFVGVNNFSFDTTIPNVLDVKAQFNSSNPSNFIQSYIGILEKTY